ncbi:MAG: acyltransferase [Muribaculum sp.]|nr:acyltransferase [Muribaculum sp.]
MHSDNHTAIRFIPEIKLVMILLVVSVHTELPEITPGGEDHQPLYWYAVNLPSFMTEQFASAVFFVLSAYLYFRNTVSLLDMPVKSRLLWQTGWRIYTDKLRKRVRTLLVPYMIWNVICLALLYVKYKWLGMPDYGVFAGGREGLARMATGFWDLGTTGYPYAFAFWYIRNLMVYILLAPLAWLIGRSHILTAIFFAWYALLPTDTYEFQWFVLGAWLALRRCPLPKVGWRFVLIFLILGLVAGFAIHFIEIPVLRKTIRIFGVCIVFTMCCSVGKALYRYEANKVMAVLTGSTFMIYAVHQCFCTKAREICLHIFGADNFFQAECTYLMSFTVLTLSGVTAYVLLRKLSPRTLSVLSGGRE